MDKEHRLLHKKIKQLREKNELLQDSLVIERRCRKAAWKVYRERTQGSFFSYIVYMLNELNITDKKSKRSFHKATISEANRNDFKRTMPG